MNPHVIYYGSDGSATKALYDCLENMGHVGIVAVNLFRACKCSERAKQYRGGIRGKGSYKSMAYDRKQWSIDNLCKVLTYHAEELGIRWGWKQDAETIGYPWVLYVDLPTGQASFHSSRRGPGQDYDGEWDGLGMSATHIIAWCTQLLSDNLVKEA